MMAARHGLTVDRHVRLHRKLVLYPAKTSPFDAAPRKLKPFLLSWLAVRRATRHVEGVRALGG
jgi:hypothetical protein